MGDEVRIDQGDGCMDQLMYGLIGAMYGLISVMYGLIGVMYGLVGVMYGLTGGDVWFD